MKISQGSTPFDLADYDGEKTENRASGKGVLTWSNQMTLSGFFVDGRIDGIAILKVQTSLKGFSSKIQSKLKLPIVFSNGEMKYILLDTFNQTADYKALRSMRSKLVRLHIKWASFDEDFWCRNTRQAARACDEIDFFLAEWDATVDQFENYFWDSVPDLLLPLWEFIDRDRILKYSDSFAYRSIDIEGAFLFDLRSQLYTLYRFLVDRYFPEH